MSTKIPTHWGYSKKNCYVFFREISKVDTKFSGFVDGSKTPYFTSSKLLKGTRFNSTESKKARRVKALVVRRNEREIYNLDSWFVTGFADGEGCFTIEISPRKDLKLGWTVKPRFQIGLNVKDIEKLDGLKNFFGDAGSINFKHGPKTIQLRVQSLKGLEHVINHFDHFTLITKKQADYILFKRVFILIKNREHLTPEGLRKIVAFKAVMNLGLSDKLSIAFYDVVPAERPEVELPTIIDPEWLAGFTSAEGSFIIVVTPSKTRVDYEVRLIFQLTQHVRDKQLMISFIAFFNCGRIRIRGEAIDFMVTKFSDIDKKIIQFFKKYKIRGVKALDFEDWVRAAELIKEKKHLTPKGLEEINKIKAGMNKGRKF